MKTLLKILAVLFLLCLVVLAGGYFLLTNSGFQKRMIEKRLPEGSSLESVKVTLGSASMQGLVLALPDGTRVKLRSVDTEMSPLAALLDRTIDLGVLEVDGLLVTLPTALIPAQTEDPSAPATGSGSASTPGADRPAAEAGDRDPVEREDPLQSLYALADLDWLFDIEGIDVDGEIRDAAGNQFSFELDSGPIKPGQTSVLKARASLVSGESLQAGLKAFDASVEIGLSQLAAGGFDSIRLQGELSGADRSGERLIAASTTLDLKIDGFQETATLRLTLAGDIPQPAVFMPELSSLGSIDMSADLDASAKGAQLLLRTADGSLSAGGSRVVAIDLRQSLSLGGQQAYTGELLSVQLAEMPLAWVNPFLGEGMAIRGAPLSMNLRLSGESNGTLLLETVQPISAGPLTVTQEGRELLREVTVTLNPVVRVAGDQTIDYELNLIQVSDRYGAFIDASAKGWLKPVERGPDNPFAGIRTDASMQVDLASLLNQPFLDRSFALLGGSLMSNITLDGSSDYPLKAQGSLQKLRTPDAPAGRDYRFAAQLRQTSPGVWQIGSSLEAGPEARPSTRLQFAGEATPESQPLKFSAKLTGERVTQSDLTHLAAAFAEKETTARPTPSLPGTSPQAPQPSRPAEARTPAPAAGDAAPPWADLDGRASVAIQEIYLDSGQTVTGLNAEARVSESLLALEQIKAQAGEGKLSGKSEIRYAPTKASPYDLAADFNFTDVDPSIFAKPGESFPVRGNFNGEFKVGGSGGSLEEALDAAQGGLTISGTDGVVTAFELDGRTQLGLIGAGILGQQLNRPGITALAQTVPYFKDIRFDDFTVKLNRGDDRRLMIPEMRIQGQNLLIDASGFVAATSWAEMMDQPLNLKLTLGAKGKLVDYLETLSLLKPATSEDGFRRWNQDMNIGGTLGDPDTSAIMELLNKAARQALSKPAAKEAAPATESGAEAATPTTDATTQAAPAESKKKLSKEEKVAEDVKKGLDLLNSVLGN